jgi:hypothetical protein
MKYFVKENSGKGFITHEDNQLSHVSGYPANVWVTDNTAWATRVGAIEKTKEEAQSLVNDEIAGKIYPEGHPNAGQQIVVNLP